MAPLDLGRVPLSEIVALQRSAGNRAVQRLARVGVGSDATVQRNGGAARRERLAAYLQAVQAGRWADVVTALGGFSEPSMRQRIGALSHDQRVSLVRAALKGSPGLMARITQAVIAVDAPAERVGRLLEDWDAAFAARNWGPAAVALNGLPDPERARLVFAVPVDQLRALKGAAAASLGGAAGPVVDLVDRRISVAVITAGAALTGQLRWRGGQGPDPGAGYQLDQQTAWGHQDDFALWIVAGGPVPGPTSTMNCWEAVLFFAYQAGVIPMQFLRDMHNAATASATAAVAGGADEDAATHAWYTTLQSRMHSGPLQTYTIDPGTGVGQPDIPAGNIVFIGGLDHVVLSRGSRDGSGRMRVLSLWIFPAHLPAGPLNEMTSYGVVQETTVEQVRLDATDVVTYGKPPW